MTQAPERETPAFSRVEPRGVGVVVALGLALLAVACPDPEGKLDEFLENTKELRDFPANKKDVGAGEVTDVSGTFLMAVASIIDPSHPLQFLVEQDFRPEGEGGLLDLTLQPLALDMGSTDTPRTPVGNPITITDIVVDENGQYVVPAMGFQTFMVTGEANPITGSNIVTELRYVGTIQGENFLCGAIEGNVLEPLQASLEGSTFAAIRVTDTSPGALPVPYVDFTPDCSGVGEETTTGGDTGGSTG